MIHFGVPSLWRNGLHLRQHVAQCGHRFYRFTSDQSYGANIEFVLQRCRESLRFAEADCIVPSEELAYGTLSYRRGLGRRGGCA